MKENSGIGTVIGSFTTIDPDIGQSHALKLLNSAGGRFLILGKQLVVAIANFNYETKRTHTIVVRSSDNGSPPKYVDKSFTIYVRDMCDRPTNLALSGYKLKENAPVNTKIGTLSASDEDGGQLTYTITDSAGGRFAIRNKNVVVRGSSGLIDYETTTRYVIVVQVKDSCKPAMTASKRFTIEILNDPEPPASIVFTSSGGKKVFANNTPICDENLARGTGVGTLVAYDPDAGAKLVWGLDNSAGGRFSAKTKGASCTPVNVNVSLFPLARAIFLR